MKSTYKSKDDLSGMKVRGRYPRTIILEWVCPGLLAPGNGPWILS